MSHSREPIIIFSDEDDSDGHGGEIACIGMTSAIQRPITKSHRATTIGSASEEDEIPGIDDLLHDAVMSSTATNEPFITSPKRLRAEGDNATDAPSAPDSASQTNPIQGKDDRKMRRLLSKEERLLAKAAGKAQKEADRSFQKKLAEVNKLRTSKHDSVREIRLSLSNDLASPASPIAAALPEVSSRFKENLSEIRIMSPEESPVQGAIRIERHIKARYDHNAKRFMPIDSPFWEWDPAIIIVVDAESIVDTIALGEDSLIRWIQDARLKLKLDVESQVIIIMKDLAKYTAKTRTLANREFTALARAGLDAARNTSDASSSAGRLSKDRIEASLLDLQVKERVFLVQVDKTEEMEDWLWNLCADIALRPYKLLSKSHLSFATGETKRKAHSASDALEAMLQEVQGITPSAASGIASEYPSFAILMRSFEKAERRGGPILAEQLLSECEIRTLRNGTANGRKLNKALAKRVYQVFCGEDSLALA